MQIDVSASGIGPIPSNCTERSEHGGRNSGSDIPIVAPKKDRIVFHSMHFCPTLEACKVLEIDTEYVHGCAGVSARKTCTSGIEAFSGHSICENRIFVKLQRTKIYRQTVVPAFTSCLIGESPPCVRTRETCGTHREYDNITRRSERSGVGSSRTRKHKRNRPRKIRRIPQEL